MSEDKVFLDLEIEALEELIEQIKEEEKAREDGVEILTEDEIEILDEDESLMLANGNNIDGETAVQMLGQRYIEEMKNIGLFDKYIRKTLTFYFTKNRMEGMADKERVKLLEVLAILSGTSKSFAVKLVLDAQKNEILKNYFAKITGEDEIKNSQLEQQKVEALIQIRDNNRDAMDVLMEALTKKKNDNKK